MPRVHPRRHLGIMTLYTANERMLDPMDEAMFDIHGV